MLNNLKRWIEDNLIDVETQVLSDDYYGFKLPFINKPFCFENLKWVRVSKLLYSHTLHTYQDTAVLCDYSGKFDVFEYPVEIWAEREIYFIKGTPSILRNLLSFKKSRLMIRVTAKDKEFETNAPLLTGIIRYDWIQFKYDEKYYDFLREITNGL
jgi:hypothetical protein